jgi:NADH-quinone oxidoreductase subunit G
VAWVPRRAGERGALEAGALPTLLPGGRPVADAAARVDVATAWDVGSLPSAPGRDGNAMLDAVHRGDIRALVVGGVDPHDLPDPAAALAALDAAAFVVSLELRASTVTERADVVFPVAPAVEKAGTFLDWEGRLRPFTEVLRGTNAIPDVRVLHMLAAAMGVDLRLPDAAAARRELADLDAWDGRRSQAPNVQPVAPPVCRPGEAILASWHLLLDAGRLQDDEPFLAGTARPPVALVSGATLERLGADEGDDVTVTTEYGTVTLPVATREMPDDVVWIPANSVGSAVGRDLRVASGSVVRLSRGGSR